MGEQSTGERMENPFAKLKSLDGLEPDEGICDVERNFLAALSLTYGATDLLIGNETATRFTIALDLADKISELGPDRSAIEFTFRPFTVEEGRVHQGEPFRVRIERVEGTEASLSPPDSAADPCCMWKWDPILKRFICVAMC